MTRLRVARIPRHNKNPLRGSPRKQCDRQIFSGPLRGFVEWDGLKFRYTYDFKLDPAWNRDEMKVVAVLSNYDSSNPTKCVVENCGALALKDGTGLTSGVESVTETADIVPVAYYDLCGTRLEAPVKGINIVKMSDGSAKKVLVQ